jgi:hypothetical protein
LLDTSAFELDEIGKRIVDTYLCGLQRTEMHGQLASQ